MSIFNFLGVSPEQKEFAKTLRLNNRESRRVIGRGTVFVDPKEIQQSEKFKDLMKKANKIVEAS